ncbi:Phosphoenolpyruvate carboxylase-related kinase 1 isoform 1 [Theobroma cacao]|uniref:non-specific serine/threonine protein kinase n=3 Tax=Theobroma cacao TaxID=3641 RepID=A0A061G5D3_THECC|nr:Phosphoenolpyruvate carboxylase-related kinase 1 isoform 1 [Theobroma cacao]
MKGVNKAISDKSLTVYHEKLMLEVDSLYGFVALIGMEIVTSNNISLPSIQFCNCYKVASLAKTIMDTTQISNLRDQYVLGGQLGWGQFGVIRACSDKLTGEVLACKSIAKDRLVTPDDFCSIKLEIEIMTRLSGHPNVVDLKAVYEDEDFVHLVMELCAGGELFHRLEKYGSFSEFEARVLFKHLMEVVKYCHDNGIVHRDLKPENILLATKSSSSPIKLADFGLATYIKQGQSLHGTVGSPFYIAPEVLAGGYNQAADVWSAGVILYILLSGMPPFGGKTKSKIFDAVRAAELRFPTDPWDHISVSARDLITRMLCVDPSKRLTAAKVLAHPWVEDCREVAEEALKHDNLDCRELEVGGGSFAMPFVDRNQDYSFSDGSPVSANGQLGTPAFTCKSSFSSFLVENASPCSESVGFSFSSCCQSSAAEFSSTIPSMPSFTFFSPTAAVEPLKISLEAKAETSKMGKEYGESNLVKLFMLPDTSVAVKHKTGEVEQKTEIRRGGSNGSRLAGIHSKRNHTIGLGEFDHFDLVVTESVIRWASCTHIPTAPSLRLSLVC